jgi:hypothetical protein
MQGGGAYVQKMKENKHMSIRVFRDNTATTKIQI